MATRNVVPRANGEGSVGIEEKHWGSGWMDETNTDAVMPIGNDNNIGTSNKKWKEGHFKKLVADDVIAKGPVVDVRAFGAKGDGVTDDTAAINQACQEGKTIIIPDGVYLIDCTMASKGSVNGGIMPKSNTTIIMNNATMVVKTNTSSAYALFNLYQVDDVKIIGGKITGDRDTHTYGEGTNEWGHGIRIIGCNRITIKGVTIEETIGDGIDITEFTGQEHSTDVLIENCIINHVRRNGISIEHASNVKITQNKITNISGTAPQAAIDLEPNSMGYYRVHDIFIDKNYISDCVGGSIGVVEGKNIYITNNIQYNVGGGTMPGSFSTNEKVIYTGNTLIQKDGTVRNFFLGSNSIITGNYISGCRIYLTESYILNIKNILFNDNICDDCNFSTALGGGQYDVVCDNVKISNNIITINIEGDNIDLTQTSVKAHEFGTRDGFGGKKIYGINIDNNIFEFYGTDNILTPSNIISNKSSIALGLIDSTFKNNIIKNAPCAILVGNGKNTRIEGNKFYNLGFKKMYRAVYVWNGTDKTVYFSNNDFIYDSDIMPRTIFYAERDLYALNNTLKTNVQMDWFMVVTSGTNCCFLNNIAKNAVTTSVIHAIGQSSEMVEANNIM
jgi:hypothetical protein